jgi:hypothetical protein
VSVKISQQTGADPRKGENDSEGKHGGGSTTKMEDRAFHHHRGALRSIAKNERLGEGEFIAADGLLTCTNVRRRGVWPWIDINPGAGAKYRTG